MIVSNAFCGRAMHLLHLVAVVGAFCCKFVDSGVNVTSTEEIMARLTALERQVSVQDAMNATVQQLREANFTQSIRMQQIESRNMEMQDTIRRLRRLLKDSVQVTKSELIRVDARCSNSSWAYKLAVLSQKLDMHERRVLQDSQCSGDGLQAMLDVCCPTGASGSGHRLLQGVGCDSFPETCSPLCAPLLIGFYEVCHIIIEALTAGDKHGLDRLYASCQDEEASRAVMLAGARPALMFHVLVIENEADARQSGMFGGTSTVPIISPISPLPIGQPPPSPTSSGAAAAVHEFRQICSKANLTVCAPPCNHVSDGFLLSILISGRGTVMTCSQEDGVFSWQGQSALGSCITTRPQTWLENIITHAAGTFALEIAVSIAVAVAADLVAGQSAILQAKEEAGEAILWSYSGEGAAFSVGTGAQLEISGVTVAALSGLAFRVAGSSTVILTALLLQKGDGSASAVSCARLATGVGQSALACSEPVSNGVSVAGPLFISTSGSGFGTGATKYMGGDRGVFEEAVSTREPGLYTCQITHDEVVTLPLPVESAMHVAVVGDDSMPQWSYTGQGAAFTVAVHSYLNLAYVTLLDGGISTMRGGEVSVDHAQLRRTQLGVAGALAVSNSELDDVELDTSPEAVITMEAVIISGTGTAPLAFNFDCMASINSGEIRNLELHVEATGELHMVGTTVRVEGMVVSVAPGGRFSVAASQLIHGEVTDPFPCNGADMHCSTAHPGEVVVAGPASINTAAPLVCTDDTAGSCLSGYVDMPSCLADIATGMTSCFIYLQRDSGDLGAITVATGQYFEVHGQIDQQAVSTVLCLASFEVEPAAELQLHNLELTSDTASALSIHVDAGGNLQLTQVELTGGLVQSSGAVTIADSALSQVHLQILARQAVAGSNIALQLSSTTLTNSTIDVLADAEIVGHCVLTNSPISIGEAGQLSLSDSELRSDGSATPLAVEAHGTASVTAMVIRSTSGQAITAVSVAQDSTLLVSESQLIQTNGLTNPFPCNGQGVTCESAHASQEWINGPAVVGMSSPFVCAADGDCMSGYLSTAACFVDLSSRGTDVCFIIGLGGETVSEELVIQPGRSAQVNADASGTGATLPWGSGAITVQENGQLELHSVRLQGRITVTGSLTASDVIFGSTTQFQLEDGGSATVTSSTFQRSSILVGAATMRVEGGELSCGSHLAIGGGAAVSIMNTYLAGQATIAAGGQLGLTRVVSPDFPTTAGEDMYSVAEQTGLFTVEPAGGAIFAQQCREPYELLTEPWRHIDAVGADQRDSTGGRWYRVGGDAGTGLATANPGYGHCSTSGSGWLSDCSASSPTPFCRCERFSCLSSAACHTARANTQTYIHTHTRKRNALRTS